MAVWGEVAVPRYDGSTGSRLEAGSKHQWRACLLESHRGNRTHDTKAGKIPNSEPQGPRGVAFWDHELHLIYQRRLARSQAIRSDKDLKNKRKNIMNPEFDSRAYSNKSLKIKDFYGLAETEEFEISPQVTDFTWAKRPIPHSGPRLGPRENFPLKITILRTAPRRH